jgi:hypothetical protein
MLSVVSAVRLTELIVNFDHIAQIIGQSISTHRVSHLILVLCLTINVLHLLLLSIISFLVILAASALTLVIGLLCRSNRMPISTPTTTTTSSHD